MVASSFYVYLPSNTRNVGNKTSKFTVPLSKKIEFNSNWTVALTGIIYNHSWATLGTHALQFIEIEWQDGTTTRLYLPSASFSSEKDVEQTLNNLIANGRLCFLTKKRHKRQAPEGEDEEGSKKKVARITTASVTSPDESLKEASVDQPPAETSPLKEEDGFLEQFWENFLSDSPLGVRSQAIDALQPLVQVKSRTDKMKESVEKVFDQLRGSDHNRTKPMRFTQPSMIETHDFPPINYTESNEDYEDDEEEDKCPLTRQSLPYSQLSQHFSIIFDSDLQKFTFKIDSQHIKEIRMSDQLAYLLGSVSKTRQTSGPAEFPPELRGGIDCMFVYAPNLVEPTIIGNTLAPLLRIVKVKGKQGQMVEETLLNPEYRRVIDKQISEISVEIRDNSGRLIPFQSGDLIAILNFRKSFF